MPSTALCEEWILITAGYTWCQSPRIELVSGEDTTSSEGSILFPRELLRRRSRTFRKRIALHDEKEISLPDTSVQTLTEFFIWSNRPDPHLEDRLSFPEVVHLGIFAWEYQISALSNQVTDKVRENLASGEWQLQAAIVDAVYQATEPNSPLREVVRSALGQLSRSVIAGEEWESTFRNNRDLGWDYLRAGDKEWARQDYLSGVCRFHNHDGIKRQEGLCDGCPFAEADCYPDWEESVGQEFEKSEHELPSQPENAAEVAVEEPGIGAPEAVSEPEPIFEEPMPEPEPEPTFDERLPEPEPEPIFDERLPEPEPILEESMPEPESETEPAVAEPPVGEIPIEGVPVEEAKPVKVDGNSEAVEEANGVRMNGHVESEDAEEVLEDADGTETPHANGVRAGSLAEEESLYPESLSSDRENPVAIPQVNGTMAAKGNVKAVVTEVPEGGNRKLSKNQKKKMAKRLSRSTSGGN
ncbi:hypothetical protein A1O7_08012 [Cladophialophora yegresii CBS 114405]|uniref:BTB domain-containing protein n=1 Tax=Cladophialophora yegresii CBS 114405 TaxID=1182544 RepID=W9VHF9_9EURO|nr:uncharacterized protein A1O7_08012 [Cladophialophora yegresii CBS 114405]EXJ55087.1 hypothetical protein A1O7_08012 [Cladophialophora yegresii CBS 114405]